MESAFAKEQEAGCAGGCCGTDAWGRISGNSDEYKAENADFDLAREMYELSFQERENILEEIHGVAKIQEETPEFVSDRISGLDEAILEIPKHRRKALDRAIFLKPSIQNDERFKLLFLRTEYFDCKKAANRMNRYFQRKLYLFGEEKLVKDITLDDLEETDIEVGFKSGCCVELPKRDRSGRPMAFFDLSKLDFNNDYVCCVVRNLTLLEPPWLHFNCN
jgi:hypothetical protein